MLLAPKVELEYQKYVIFFKKDIVFLGTIYAKFYNCYPAFVFTFN